MSSLGSAQYVQKPHSGVQRTPSIYAEFTLGGSVHLSFKKSRTLVAPNSKNIGRDHCCQPRDTKNETVLISIACSTHNTAACQVFLDDPEKNVSSSE